MSPAADREDLPVPDDRCPVTGTAQDHYRSEHADRRAPSDRRSRGRAAALLDQHGEEILAVYRLPDAHRKRMRSTNMLERVNREIKRRTRVIRLFPNEQARVRLVSTLRMELNQEWMERLYLRMEEPTAASADAEKKVA